MDIYFFGRGRVTSIKNVQKISQIQLFSNGIFLEDFKNIHHKLLSIVCRSLTCTRLSARVEKGGTGRLVNAVNVFKTKRIVMQYNSPKRGYIKIQEGL